MVRKTSEIALIGREKELGEMSDDLKQDRSIRLLIGESGIGKSALLDEYYRTLTEEMRDEVFVGYYSRDESLIAESESLIYPFRILLRSFVENAKESQHLNERMDNTISRVKRGLLKSAKEQGVKMGVAIIQDLANKAGLKQTFEVGKEVIKAIGEEKTSLMLGQSYVADHKDEARESYLDIFKAIANDFADREFVLIFDQFESVGKASTDFFLNFAKFILMQDRFHIIVCFRTDDRILADLSKRNVFQDLRSNVKRELGGEITELGGLSPQDIGTWIKLYKGKTLPMVPDLLRIREYSGGLPILLDEWIKSSKGLNYEEWIKSSHGMDEKTKDKRDILCEEFNKLKENLEDTDDKTNLGKLSILQQPLKTHEGYATYLEIKDIEKIPALFEKLAKSRIFDDWISSDSNSIWFRHELIQKCIEENLGDERRSRFHDKAAKFFLDSQIKNQGESADQIGYKSNGQTNDLVSLEEAYSRSIALAYHLHLAKNNTAQSFAVNKDLGDKAYVLGDLDLAERCYNRALDDTRKANRLQDEMNCLFSLTTNVYATWGRYDEALVNFQILLKYYHETNDSQMYSASLNNLGMIYSKRGEYDQAITKFNESLEMARQLGDQQGISLTLGNIGSIHNRRGEYDQAITKFNESLEISRQLGDQQGIAGALGNIGLIHSNRGEVDQAIEKYNESLEMARQLGDRQGIARALNNLGLVHSNRGEYDQAIEKFNESLEIKKQLGDRQGIAYTLGNIGSIHNRRGEYDQAITKFNESLEVARQLGDRNLTGLGLNNLGLIHDSRGEYDQAIEKYNESLEVARQLGDRQAIAYTLNNLGLIHDSRGEYDQAIEKFNESLEIKKQLGDRQGIAYTLNNLGLRHNRRGEYDQAITKFNESLEVARQLGDRNLTGMVLNNLGLVHSNKGEYDQAITKFNESLEISRQLGDQQGIARTLNNLGLIHSNRGEVDQAIEKYNESLEMAKQLGDQQGIARTLGNIGLIHDSRGEYHQAITKYNESLEISRQLGDQQGIARALGYIGLILYNREEYRASFQHAIQAYSILKQIQSPENERVQSILFDIRDKLGDKEFQELLNRSGHSFE